jgi:hypothetical protein
MHVQHLLPELVPKGQELRTNVLEIRSRVVVDIVVIVVIGSLRRRHRGYWGRRVRGLSRHAKLLGHLLDLVGSALSEAES